MFTCFFFVRTPHGRDMDDGGGLAAEFHRSTKPGIPNFPSLWYDICIIYIILLFVHYNIFVFYYSMTCTSCVFCYFRYVMFVYYCRCTQPSIKRNNRAQHKRSESMVSPRSRQNIHRRPFRRRPMRSNIASVYFYIPESVAPHVW